jgi:hypothetical protein
MAIDPITGEQIDEMPGANTAETQGQLAPGGTLLGNLPEDLTPEEAERIRDQRVAAFAGPDVDAENIDLPSEVVDKPGVAKGSTFITPEATVQGQLEQILRAGSPLQTLAESRADEEAQRRGLLASSMAVGAGQKALYDTALEVARPDAGTHAKAGLTEQAQTYGLDTTQFEGDIAGALKTLDAQLQFTDTAQKGQIQKELQFDAAMQDLVKQGVIDQAAMERLTAELDTKEAINAANILAEVNLKNADLSFKNWEVIQQVDAKARSEMIGSLKSLSENFNQSYVNLQAADINKTAKEQMTQQLVAGYQAQVQMLADIYDQDVSWTGGPGVAPTTGEVPPMPPVAPATGHEWSFNPYSWTWEQVATPTGDTGTPGTPGPVGGDTGDYVFDPENPDQYSHGPQNDGSYYDQAAGRLYQIGDVNSTGQTWNGSAWVTGNETPDAPPPPPPKPADIPGYTTVLNPDTNRWEYQVAPIGDQTTDTGDQTTDTGDQTTDGTGLIDPGPNAYYPPGSNTAVVLPDGTYKDPVTGQPVEIPEGYSVDPVTGLPVLDPTTDEVTGEVVTNTISPYWLSEGGSAGIQSNLDNGNYYAAVTKMTNDDRSGWAQNTTDAENQRLLDFLGNPDVDDQLKQDVFNAVTDPDADPRAPLAIIDQADAAFAQQEQWIADNKNTYPWVDPEGQSYIWPDTSYDQVQLSMKQGDYNNVISSSLNNGTFYMVEPNFDMLLNDFRAAFPESEYPGTEQKLAGLMATGASPYTSVYYMKKSLEDGAPTTTVMNHDFDQYWDPGTGTVNYTALPFYKPYPFTTS